MYPTLPIGPLALPTAPFLTIMAAVVGLEIMSRYGRRARISADDLWNVGLITMLVGLIVSRLWNVVRLWAIYSEEPHLIISLRPSGFEIVPGVIAGLIAGYGFMLWRRLPPTPVIASALVGIVAGSVVTGAAGYLAGTVAGVPNEASWYLNPLDPNTHPAGLYQAAGMLLLFVVLLIWSTPVQPWQAVGGALLGLGIVRLVADGFVADAAVVGSLRISQLVALGLAIGGCLLLARASARKGTQVGEQEGASSGAATI